MLAVVPQQLEPAELGADLGGGSHARRFRGVGRHRWHANQLLASV